MKILCVAEKPSIAKSVAEILSGGQFNKRSSPAKYISNWDFSYRLGSGAHTRFTMTAVTGHLTSSDFDENYRRWQSVDPMTLFDAPIITYIKDEHKPIARNLEQEARQADQLMIWTDCDREGEHIGSEIVNVVRKVRPHIHITRAKFSAIIPAQIHNAVRNTVPLDMRSANAVDARIALDLRVGAAMTRMQTLALQARFGVLAEKVISYGPCQFPTLGFVVDQYEKARNFVPETFWYIHLALERDGDAVNFHWQRNRLFDVQAALLLYEMCIDQPQATVIRTESKSKQKYKPLPLTTVDLQKSGSRLLKMSPKSVLEHAEKLYQKGFVSYPRTETDIFDKDFNFMDLIDKQTTDGAWGSFATGLKNGGFERPRNGRKNDQAHPPIHPTAHASSLSGDEKRVYELITRRFLACCSRNGVGIERTVQVCVADELFSASGLIILERNYLDVYPYDKWSASVLPDFQEGEVFMPSVCELKDGETTAPNLLTEADLVSLMDKNGIGTDATIAEHIATIISREYVVKQKMGNTEYLLPSTLGCGLVNGYNSLGFDKSLSKPHLRRETEQRMGMICDGMRSKREVIDESVEEYRDVFAKSRRDFNLIAEAVDRHINMPQQPAARARRSARQGPIDLDSDSFGGDDNDDDDDLNGGGPLARRGTASRAGGSRGTTRGRGAKNARSGPTSKRKRDSDDEGGFGGPGGGGSSPSPRCQCGQEAVERTVKAETANKGRTFYACPKAREESCQFFEWADAAPKSSGPSSKPRATPSSRPSDSGIQRCSCGLTAALKTVSKEGPNTGRQFYMCNNVSKSAQCKYFEWADEAGGGGGSQTQPFAGTSTSASASNYSCFKCGEQGHFSNQCPGGTGTGRRGSSSTRTSRGRGSRHGSSRGRGGRGGSSRGRGRGRGGSTYQRLDTDSE